VLEPLVDVLDCRLDAIAADSVGRTQPELASCQHLPESELVPLLRANLAEGTRVFRGLPAEVSPLDAGRRRAGEGVAIEGMLNGWRQAPEQARAAVDDVEVGRS
jgi:hypothetical protein